jgi:hypothetical protein
MTSTTHHGPRVAAPGGRRRSADRRLHPALFVLQLVCRWFIAAALLFYSAGKVFGTQLAYSTIVADTPVAHLSGFELMWQFYGWSRGFVGLIAAVQVAVAVLLVVPRTTRLGYLLTIGLMGNITVMDIFYGIAGGLEAALALLGAALVLLLIDLRPLLRFLFAAPMVPADAKPRVAVRFGGARFVALPLVAAGVFGLAAALVQLPEIARPELHGIWQADGSSELVRFVVDDGQLCALRDRDTLMDAPRYAECTIDPAADRLTIAASDPAGELPDFRFTGGYELADDGTRLVLRPDDGSPSTVLTRLAERERYLTELPQ